MSGILFHMAVILTDEQQRQVDSDGQTPAEVIDPRTNRRFRLVPEDEYERLADRADQDALRAASSRTLSRRLAEGE